MVSEGSGSVTACPVRWRSDEARAVLVEPASDNAEKIDKKCVMKHMAELWLKVNYIFFRVVQRTILLHGRLVWLHFSRSKFN